MKSKIFAGPAPALVECTVQDQAAVLARVATLCTLEIVNTLGCCSS